jgi:hypothetical protein
VIFGGMRVWEWRRRFCVVRHVRSALSKRAGHTLAPDRDGRAVAERLMQISTRATGFSVTTDCGGQGD